ncbi:MAG: sigma-70 family RNA polymerase sigma factor [Pirellulaceae bacterium]|nr:sigma-70 family RNA polymerase sigma factor [Pirellulaceae bacterium]
MSRKQDQSFVELFVKNQRRIYGYILTVVPDCNEADDLFQQTSMVLWEKVGDFRPKRAARANCPIDCNDADGEADAHHLSEDFVRWGCGIAHNLIRNWRVKKGRDRHCFSDEMLARLATVRAEKSDWLEAALAALGVCMDDLKPAERELLTLCYADDRSIRRISAELGQSEGAVYQKLHRIRAKLYDCIENKTRDNQPS